MNYDHVNQVWARDTKDKPARHRRVKVLPLCLKSLPAIASSGEAGGEERIARKIVDAAYAVHKILGPGLLEKVYEVCL